ncbi:MAG: metallopeptidase family protein [Planctomycetaceae bacterium]|nr:metallopeptidase family protein [Planctomycetaceae bacterium]
MAKRYNWQPQVPNMIILFRRGIYAQAVNEQGMFSRSELRRPIRITILHELGHFHGLDDRNVINSVMVNHFCGGFTFSRRWNIIN